ncbi:uncharacterized protein LOC142469970 isoform X2 [Ascaphus truei]|uniref:uncharacterized protein LOC142469970 isoform X2 n=1 Tax=Ascaphus truei TaxID=8439 RepID=UPI003F5A98B6
MGGKLSKKKKGYCLGAGKEGESTETTEVEQKEPEIQDGQKGAAESNGEKPQTDKTESNGASEQKSQAKEQPGEEVTSSETTKDDSNTDQMPESCVDAKQEQAEKTEASVEARGTSQDKKQNTEGAETSPAVETPQLVQEPEKIPKDELNKNLHSSSAAKDSCKPTVLEPEVKESKVPEQAEVKESKVPEQAEVKESKVLEQAEVKESKVPEQAEVKESKVPEQAEVKESKVPEQAEVKESKVPEQAEVKESKVPEQAEVKESKVPEQAEVKESKMPEQVEVKESKVPGQREAPQVNDVIQDSVAQAPLLSSIPVTAQDVMESKQEMHPEPEQKQPVAEKKVDYLERASEPVSALDPMHLPQPMAEQAPQEHVHAPEPVTEPAAEAVVDPVVPAPVAEHAVPEPAAKPDASESVQAPMSETDTEAKHVVVLLAEPPKQTQVPEQLAQVKTDEHTAGTSGIHQESGGGGQNPIATETESAGQPSNVVEVALAKQEMEKKDRIAESPPKGQEDAAELSISKEPETPDVHLGEQSATKNLNHVSDVHVPEQDVQGREADGKAKIKAGLETEQDKTASNTDVAAEMASKSSTTELHDPAAQANSEDKILNHATPFEVDKENVSSAMPQINDKQVVRNGLPIKEETKVKANLETGSYDHLISDLNRQNEDCEMQVCTN